MFWVIALIYAIIFAFACHYVAEQKGKDGGHWAVIGFFLGLIGLLIIGFTPPEEKDDNVYRKNTSLKRTIYNVKYVDEDSPVQVTEIVVRVGEDKVFIKPTFFNVSNKTIKGIKAMFICYDSFGSPVKEPPLNSIEKVFQDLSLSGKAGYSPDKEINLPELPNTRKVDIVITSVLFEDETVWEIQKKQLPKNEMYENKLANFKYAEEIINDLKKEKIDLRYVNGDIVPVALFGGVPKEKQELINEHKEELIKYYETKQRMN